jgi:hypothetical protein
VAYAGATLVASVFSVDPKVSLVDSKQLVLLIIVPLTYRLFRGRRALLAVDVIITVGAVSATWGIVQYLILNFDHLGQRPRGTLGLYMTYSGLLMLVTCAAVSRVMFAKHHRTWAALVLPALLFALVFTFTRSAWVGACVGIGLLFLLRDFQGQLDDSAFLASEADLSSGRLANITPAVCPVPLLTAPQRFAHFEGLGKDHRWDRVAHARSFGEDASRVVQNPRVISGKRAGAFLLDFGAEQLGIVRMIADDAAQGGDLVDQTAIFLIVQVAGDLPVDKGQGKQENAERGQGVENCQAIGDRPGTGWGSRRVFQSARRAEFQGWGAQDRRRFEPAVHRSSRT